jgi:hypothetical protein
VRLVGVSLLILVQPVHDHKQVALMPDAVAFQVLALEQILALEQTLVQVLAQIPGQTLVRGQMEPIHSLVDFQHRPSSATLFRNTPEDKSYGPPGSIAAVEKQASA